VVEESLNDDETDDDDDDKDDDVIDTSGRDVTGPDSQSISGRQRHRSIYITSLKRNTLENDRVRCDFGGSFIPCWLVELKNIWRRFVKPPVRKQTGIEDIE
jgi:hypothetical protein